MLLKQVKNMIIEYVRKCALASVNNDEITYMINHARIEQITYNWQLHNKPINIAAIEKLILIYTRKYRKSHIKSEIQEIEAKRRKEKKIENYINKIHEFWKRIAKYICINSRYIIKEYVLPKNSIYKQRVKTFKVLTCFNGKYMLHTAIF